MKNLRVVSAKPLDKNEKERIEAVFIKKEGGKVSFSYEIDESLIGGVKVINGDTVYDGTINGKLEKMKQLLNENE